MNLPSTIKNQRGIAHLVLLIAILGLIAFIIIANTLIFKNKLFESLFPKRSSFAAVNNASEAESGSLIPPATIISDSNASNGQYVHLGLVSGPTPTPTPQSSTPPNLTFQPTAPYYATFYYMWMKNPPTDGGWGYWEGAHIDPGSPPNTWFSNYLPDPNSNAFDPTNELYSSNNYETFKWQVSKMAEAKQEVAIASWWGPSDPTEARFNRVINTWMGASDNPYPNLRWAIYYEDEGFTDPSVSTLVTDLNYIKNNYASSPYFFKINGKPVVFVYAGGNDVPGSMTQRWKDANNQLGNYFYVVLKVFPGFTTDPNQPNSWHQYAPASRYDAQGPYAFVSPGFWLDNTGQTERLVRDSVDFENKVKSMVALGSGTIWRMIQTWNEWGEGTGVEPAQKVKYNSATGKDEIDTTRGTSYNFKNLYIDILNRNLPALEAGTGR